ncbi:MAG: adenosylcobinamide amidohydrolase [Candidatus Bathyarchaeota archaeon]|nr:adenosylcobinamide amidohydrolase [Candidatus Bathyarchaeota archaeon]
MQHDLAEGTRLIRKDNVLAVICDNPLKTVSSAIFNGGCRPVKAVLNIGVPEGYSDLSLHLDPLQLITSSALKLGLTDDYLAMVTAANIKNYSLKTQKATDFSVTVAATAGCQHGESSGEDMDVQEIAGTINIIVFIDGNPAESCMVASLITATEAKTAALRDLDVRSRYTGDSATGSITDSVTVATNGKGKPVVLGGPASKLGKLVGACTRQAVAEALLKQEPFWGARSVADRLRERHLPLEKLAAEVSKIEGLEVSAEGLSAILRQNPVYGWQLLAASRLDEDYKKNLLPTDFEDWSSVNAKGENTPDTSAVDLPPFIKEALIQIIESAHKSKIMKFAGFLKEDKLQLEALKKQIAAEREANYGRTFDEDSTSNNSL